MFFCHHPFPFCSNINPFPIDQMSPYTLLLFCCNRYCTRNLSPYLDRSGCKNLRVHETNPTTCTRRRWRLVARPYTLVFPRKEYVESLQSVWYQAHISPYKASPKQGWSCYSSLSIRAVVSMLSPGQRKRRLGMVLPQSRSYRLPQHCHPPCCQCPGSRPCAGTRRKPPPR